MKNLSKTLSLVLAFALAFTMFAGVSAIEFSDVADVENVDAIKTMATIGVIKGYTDGTFQPDKTVTRAEMAKMIYVFKMGGEDDGAAYYTGVASKLSDISGHWAEGYIKYCENLGIIAGRGDGKFYPDDTVTGLEAAKMLLIVQGYDAEKAGLVGMGWATKTASLGADSEFFKNYGPQLAAECPREYAALMMYNALDATYMTWDNDSGSYVKSTKTEDTKTLGQKYMNLATVEGVLVGVGDETTVGSVIRTGTTAPTAGKDKISIDVERVNDSIATTTSLYDKDTHTFECNDETVADLYGQYVRASVNTKKDTILGIFAVDGKNNVVDSTVSKVQLITGETEKIKVDGTSYKIETGALVYDFGTYGSAATVTTGTAWNGTLGYFAGSTSDAAANGSAVKFIDNDGDGKFELAIVSDITAFAEVSSVSSTKFSANGTYNFDDVIVNGDIKEGAYVARTYNPFVSKYVFTVVEPVEGEATALKKVHFNNDSIRIDGTWYSLADNADHNAVNANLVDFSGTFAAGSSYKVYAVGNVIYVADKVAAGTAGNVALVIDVGANVVGNIYKTKIMLADGTKKTYDMDMKSYIDAGHTTPSGSVTGKPDVGALITYNVSDDDDDVYDLCYIGHYDKNGNVVDAGYDVYTSAQLSNAGAVTKAVTNGAFVEENSQLIDYTVSPTKGTQSIDDDAIVFIGYNDEGSGTYTLVAGTKLTFKVITGKALKAFSRDFGDVTGVGGNTTGGYSFLSDGNGFNHANVVFIFSGTQQMPGSEKGKILGYVTAEPAKVTKSNTDYTEIQIWTVDGEKTVTVKTTEALSTVHKGDVITLEPTTEEYYSNGNLKNVTTEALKNNKSDEYGYGAITAKDNKQVSFNGSSVDLADDAVILTVDTNAVEGTNDGVVPAAKTTGTSAASYSTVERFNVTSGSTTSEYYANAFYVLDTDGDVLYLVVDTNDKAWHGSKSPDTIAAEAAVTLSGTPVNTATIDIAGINFTTWADYESVIKGSNVWNNKEISYSALKAIVESSNSPDGGNDQNQSLDLKGLSLDIKANTKLIVDEDLTIKEIDATGTGSIVVPANTTVTVKTELATASLGLITFSAATSKVVVATGDATKANNTYVGTTPTVTVLDGKNTLAAWTDVTGAAIDATAAEINGTVNVTTAIANADTTTITLNGALDLDANITGTGALELGNNATLDLANSTAMQFASIKIGTTTYTGATGASFKTALEGLVSSGKITMAASTSATIKATGISDTPTATLTADGTGAITVAMS